MSYLGDKQTASEQASSNLDTSFGNLATKTTTFKTYFSIQDTKMKETIQPTANIATNFGTQDLKTKNMNINQTDFNNTLSDMNSGLSQDEQEYQDYLDWYNNIWKPAHNW